MLRRHGFLGGVFAINVGALYLIYLYAPPEATLGDLYRIMYLHIPSAWISYLAFGVTLTGCIQFLRKRSFKMDLLADASARLGIVFSGFALISGSLWASSAWGSYWNWDPRQTTTLVLWLMYVGYLSLRMSVEEREKKAKLSSVIGILGFITVPLSYLSVQLWYTLHPVILTTGGLALTGAMISTLFVALIGVTLIYIYLLKTTHECLETEEKIAELKYA